jgi:hypothetical protein
MIRASVYIASITALATVLAIVATAITTQWQREHRATQSSPFRTCFGRRRRKIMSKLKLTVNEEKTRICRVPEGEFNFLARRPRGTALQRRVDIHSRRRISRHPFCCSLQDVQVGQSPPSQAEQATSF